MRGFDDQSRIVERHLSFDPHVQLSTALFELPNVEAPKRPQAQIDAPDALWSKLTWAWIAFFTFMAVLNGYVASNYSLDTWVNFKVWWAMGLFFAFTIGNIAILAKYMRESEPEAK